MKKQHDLLGLLLAVVTGASLLITILIHTFFPKLILPLPNLSAVAVLSLATLVIDHYLLGGSRRDYRLIPVYACLIFGLFPLAGGFVLLLDALKLAVMGAVVFTAFTFLFDTMVDRLSETPATKLSPVISAFGLFLATQCLMGIF